jgi:hypothetical protein
MKIQKFEKQKNLKNIFKKVEKNQFFIIKKNTIFFSWQNIIVLVNK